MDEANYNQVGWWGDCVFSLHHLFALGPVSEKVA